MHATGIGKGLQRAGDREAAGDLQQRFCLRRTGGDGGLRQGAGGAALVDAAPFDAASMRRIVEVELRLTAEDGRGWPELHPDRTAPETIALIGCELGAGDAAGNLGWVA